MTYRFVPAAEDSKPLTIAVSFAGGSGTGKTYSALRLARGIAGGKPFGMVDTENRRGLHYRAEFPEMQHLDFSPFHEGKLVGFGPERWIDVIDAAEAAGLPVLVIDSFSHAWEGIGGVLEMHEKELDRLVEEARARSNSSAAPDRDKFSQLAWASVKPKYRRLLERIIRAQCHVIICIRAKPVMQARKKIGGEWVNANARSTKLRRDDLPWDIAADKDLVFEMTASFLMDPAAPGVPILLKCADAFKAIFGQRQMIGEEAGRAMLRWATGDDEHRANKTLLDRARDEARKGRDALNAFWKALPTEQRGIVNVIMDEIKALANDAEAAKTASDLFAGEATAPAIPPELASVLERIEGDLADGVADVEETFATEIAALRAYPAAVERLRAAGAKL